MGRQVTAFKLARVRQGVPQVQVARDAHIGVSRMSRIECGWVQPRPDEVERIALVLGVTVEDLQGRRAA